MLDIFQGVRSVVSLSGPSSTRPVWTAISSTINRPTLVRVICFRPDRKKKKKYRMGQRTSSVRTETPIETRQCITLPSGMAMYRIDSTTAILDVFRACCDQHVDVIFVTPDLQQICLSGTLQTPPPFLTLETTNVRLCYEHPVHRIACDRQTLAQLCQRLVRDGNVIIGTTGQELPTNQRQIYYHISTNGIKEK